MTSIKEVIESRGHGWKFKINYAGSSRVRIDAERRFFKPDETNRVSKWASRKYVESLLLDNYGKKINEMNNIRY